MLKFILTFLICLSVTSTSEAVIKIHYYRAVDEIHAVSYNDFFFPDRNLLLYTELYRTRMEFKKPYEMHEDKDNFNLLILRLRKTDLPHEITGVYLVDAQGGQQQIKSDALYFDMDGDKYLSRAEIIISAHPDNENETEWFKTALNKKQLHLRMRFKNQPQLDIIFTEAMLDEWKELFSPNYDKSRMQEYIENK